MVRDLPIAERHCFLVYRARRFKCEHCKKTFVERVEWKRANVSYTGARLRYSLDRESQIYKIIYKQRTAVECINNQAYALGIGRPHIRNGAAIANLNTLIYTLINLRLYQRLRQKR